ncbi:MAG: T9SS type A sorting domain-containing protein [Saprospiraceae bacterium]|nr:T9SS type A sorting domain-containing protein [Saprospiraceae bacterium]
MRFSFILLLVFSLSSFAHATDYFDLPAALNLEKLLQIHANPSNEGDNSRINKKLEVEPSSADWSANELRNMKPASLMGDTIFLPDTILCVPDTIFGILIDSTGTYNINVGPPAYPSGTVLNIFARVENRRGPITLVHGLDYVVVLLFDYEDFGVLIDYGNGDDTLFQRGDLDSRVYVKYEYPDTGTYAVSFEIYRSCDTEIIPGVFPRPYYWHRAAGKVSKYPGIGPPETIPKSTMISRFGSQYRRSRETFTDTNGAYLFRKQFEGFQASIQPSAEVLDLEDLDIADLLLLHQHLNDERLLDAPAGILAADINADNSVDITDQELLLQRLLGIESNFPDTSTSWIYWPQAYEFPDPDDPFGHPDRIFLPPVYADTSGLDFYAVKRGDLSGQLPVDTSLVGPDTLFFRLDNDPLNIGDTVTVDFHSRNFTDLVGFQFQLDFDTNALHFQGVDVGAVPGLSEDNFGLSGVDEGELRLTWLDFTGQSHSLPDEEVAFGLQFIAEQGIIDRGEHLTINEAELGAKAFDANLLEAPVQLLIDPINCVDTTYASAISCQADAPSETIAVFPDPFGCDSMVITTITVQVDTSYQQLFECDSTLTDRVTIYTNSVIRLANGCDEILVTETILLPNETTYLQLSSCNPQDTGLVLNTLIDEFGCDSIISTRTNLRLDTTYITTFVCDEGLAGVLTSIEEEADGCQYVQIETRSYDPLNYEWSTIPDTCRFGVGSAEFISNNTNYAYSFAWDGPSAEINPAEMFAGVYNVTITATSTSNGTSCQDTARVIIGNIGDLPELNFTHTGDELTYSFTGNVQNADSFYWDFGDSTTSTDLNPTHLYQEPGTYLVCLIAENGCNTTQECQAVQTPDWYNITGTVETSPRLTAVLPIVAAAVDLTSVEGQRQASSNMDGEYQFIQLFEGFSYEVRPEKEEGVLNGLDVADVIRLSQYLNASRTLVLPDQLLAGDLDCNEVVDMQDVLALQSLLLGEQSQLDNGCSNWIFWPQSYNFATPETPFGHPTSIPFENLNGDISGADFYGLKRGDLGGNADAARGGAPPDSLFLRLKNGFVATNDTFRLDFRVENFEELVGFQTELMYDTAALDFQGITLGEVPGMSAEHFGLSKVGEGIIRIVWLDILGNAHSLDDGSLAFGLRFITKTDIVDRGDHIAIDSRDLSAVAFNAELVEGPVALKVDLLTGLEASNSLSFVLLQNRPNPFNEKTLIPFELPKSSLASLRIYNQLGQLVWEKTARYPEGRSTEEVALSAPGLYYYQLETFWGQATRKMLYER